MFKKNSLKLETRLERIEKILESLKKKENPRSEGDAFIDIETAAELVKLKKSTIYKMVCLRKMPHYKIGRRLVFKREELMAWIEEGRKPIVCYEN